MLMRKEQRSKKQNEGKIFKSHIPTRVSLGKGALRENAASMQEFGGQGKVIYLIDTAIENSKTFRPNSEHPNNAEFLIKGVGHNLIKAIIVHDADRSTVEQKISEVEKLISSGGFPVQKDRNKEDEKRERIDFIHSLPIVSFEEQISNESK